MTGLTIKTVVPTNYAAMIEAMGAGQAHIGWLAPTQYIMAHGKGCADVRWRPSATALTTTVSRLLPTRRRVTLPTTTRLPARTPLMRPRLWPSLPIRNPAGPTRSLLPATCCRSACSSRSTSNSKPAPGCRDIPPSSSPSTSLPTGEICDFGATYIDARSNVGQGLL